MVRVFWINGKLEAFLVFTYEGLGKLFMLLPGELGDPFQYTFMQRALLTALLVGVVCGVLSCFVVLLKWSLLGDAISHAVLPGVALAYLLNLPFALGAFVFGSLSAFSMALIEQKTKIKQDAAMGIMLTAYFALGVVLISRLATSTQLMHILFGNVLGVRMPTLVLTFVVGIAALVLIKVFYRELLIYTFDPIHAKALGIPTDWLHYGLMLLVTATIVVSLETVGIILVVAMLITPGATAYLFCRRLTSMIFVSGLCGGLASVIGLYLSFLYNVSSGGAIVLVATAFFLVAVAVNQIRQVWSASANAVESGVDA